MSILITPPAPASGGSSVVWVGHVNGVTSHTGTTAETTLGTVTIPGGTIGPSGSVWIRFLSDLATYSGTGTATFRLKFGGTIIGSNGRTAAATVQLERTVYNQVSEAAQRIYPNIADTEVANINGQFPQSLTFDTSADIDVTFTMQLNDAASVCNLRSLRAVVFSNS